MRHYLEQPHENGKEAISKEADGNCVVTQQEQWLLPIQKRQKKTCPFLALAAGLFNSLHKPTDLPTNTRVTNCKTVAVPDVKPLTRLSNGVGWLLAKCEISVNIQVNFEIKLDSVQQSSSIEQSFTQKQDVISGSCNTAMSSTVYLPIPPSAAQSRLYLEGLSDLEKLQF